MWNVNIGYYENTLCSMYIVYVRHCTMSRCTPICQDDLRYIKAKYSQSLIRESQLDKKNDFEASGSKR